VERRPQVTVTINYTNFAIAEREQSEGCRSPLSPNAAFNAIIKFLYALVHMSMNLLHRRYPQIKETSSLLLAFLACASNLIL